MENRWLIFKLEATEFVRVSNRKEVDMGMGCVKKENNDFIDDFIDAGIN